ncbi:hypothetical protein ABIC66_000246 [Caulobacter sp. 1776]
MVTDLFFDESGYTGRALLDPVQPYLVVASSIICDADASALLREAFPAYKGDEFKFQNIWKRPGSRARLVKLAQLVADRAQDIFLWHLDKRFCVLTKLIEHLVEPLAYSRGFDLYKDGYIQRFANHTYFGLTQVGDPGLYEAVTNAYFAFANTPTKENLVKLRFHFTIMANSTPEMLRGFFGPVLQGIDEFDDHSDMATFRDTLETQVTSILSSVSFWTNKKPGVSLNIRHDQSASFFKASSLWAKIASPHVPALLHPTANGPPTAFPLPVIATAPVDSKTSPAIQLCDLLAGLRAKMLAQSPDDLVLLSEVQSLLGDVSINGVEPGDDISAGPLSLRTGPDPVDQMVSILFPKGG